MKVILLIVCLAIGETMAVHQKRSAGGVSIPIEQAPFFVSITRGGQHVCGGALITTRYVLTAAHCIVDKSKKKYPNLAVVSGNDTKYERGTLHHIRNISIASEYDGQSEWNDLGVIMLSAHVTWDIKTDFLALPTREPKFYENATFIAMGTTEKSNDLSLQQLQVKMYHHDTCLWFPPAAKVSSYCHSFWGIVEDGQSIQNVGTHVGLPHFTLTTWINFNCFIWNVFTDTLKCIDVSEEWIKYNKYYLLLQYT